MKECKHEENKCQAIVKIFFVFLILGKFCSTLVLHKYFLNFNRCKQSNSMIYVDFEESIHFFFKFWAKGKSVQVEVSQIGLAMEKK